MEFLVFLLVVWALWRWARRRRTNRQLQQYMTHGGVQTVVGAGGWYPDPTSRYVARWWNGVGWTEHVHRGDQQVRSDPLVMNISPPGVAPRATPVVYPEPDPQSNRGEPDLNELRRRFRRP